MGILLIIALVVVLAIALGLAWRRGYYDRAPSSMDGTPGTGGAADPSGAHDHRVIAEEDGGGSGD